VNVFAIRHGETAWSLSGQHTGTTDIPLTDNGRRLAERMRPVLAKETFSLVLCSPRQRARETSELAGLGHMAIIDPDLAEWNYGVYEGLTTDQIQEKVPGWLIFRDGCRGARRRSRSAPGLIGSLPVRVLPRATSLCLRTAIYCACWCPAGSICLRARDSIFCSTLAHYAFSATTVMHRQ
jgi:Histidine phosphatase superfamily (branch 1)